MGWRPASKHMPVGKKSLVLKSAADCLSRQFFYLGSSMHYSPAFVSDLTFCRHQLGESFYFPLVIMRAWLKSHIVAALWHVHLNQDDDCLSRKQWLHCILFGQTLTWKHPCISKHVLLFHFTVLFQPLAKPCGSLWGVKTSRFEHIVNI